MPPESPRLPSTQALIFERLKVEYELGFIFNTRDPGNSSMVMSSVTFVFSRQPFEFLSSKVEDVSTEQRNKNLAEEHH